ncbi:hypothetical protein [Streptomyces sp. NPDC053048]|uniref:hypothetical protein n=1 Tax=Streptomyces sp. NPDC053048 TaxID=3365694 RepID=UPI0037D21817
MNHRTGTAIAATGAILMTAAAVQVGRSDQWRQAATYTVAAVLFAVLAGHERREERLRVVLVQANRAAPLIAHRPAEAEGQWPWCCELWLHTVGQEHNENCTTLSEP